mgnify:FL=1
MGEEEKKVTEGEVRLLWMPPGVAIAVFSIVTLLITSTLAGLVPGIGPVLPIEEGKASSFAILFFLMVLIFSTVYASEKGLRIPKLRKVPGISAIEEAVGRATEMGRPIFYSPGIAGVSDQYAPQTLAALSILGYVAELSARYEIPLIVGLRDPIVVAMAEDTVKQGYMAAGKPDAFNPDNIRFLSDVQFAYASGAVGIMHRERTAANIFIGAFWAESLILAEAGHMTGAIQIAGTANFHQLPFFVAACDYVLIGEEIYAAGAYVSKDPVQIGSIAGQDYSKAVALALIIIGTITVSLAGLAKGLGAEGLAEKLMWLKTLLGK